MKRYPNPQDIAQARNNARITQTAAARIVGACLRTWQNWEAGTARMDPIKWEAFKSKVSK